MIIIIGLLIGGILKGQELINNARIVAIAKKVAAVQAAISTFHDVYSAFPGDMPNATAALAGCDNSNFCADGNGNSLIGTPYAGSEAIGDKFYNDSETFQFWKHLALADLISEINIGADPAQMEWGKTHLSSPLGGGFEMIFVQNPILNISGANGQILRLSSLGLDPTDNGSSGIALDSGSTGALTPSEAQRLDTKIDDGNPLSGKMIVWDYGWHGCDNTRAQGTTGDTSMGFDGTSAERSCVVFFMMK